MANKQKIDLRNHIPSELKNELNTSLTANLFNRFLSEEDSVYISGQVGKITDKSSAVIKADSLDRELNALVPAFYFKTGTEESVVTCDTLFSKAESIGIDVVNLKKILAEQNFNYAPPINLDKFINFSNYYWVAQETLPVPVMSWNPNLDPEYYVIARPPLTSIEKMPVTLATTRDIKLFGKDRPAEKVTITFTSANDFTIEGNQGQLYVTNSGTPVTPAAGDAIPNASYFNSNRTTFRVFAPDITDSRSGNYGVDTPTGQNFADLLFTLTMSKGDVDFEPGDVFEINITYYTGSNTIAFIPGISKVSLNKGFISNIVPDTNLMYIDGVRVKIGDTVLVKNQSNVSENGIYTVRPDKWIRTVNYDKAENYPVGSYFLISYGVTQQGSYGVTTSPISNLGVDPLTFVIDNDVSRLIVNDWQTHNYWVHSDDIDSLASANVIQATRPIVEYDHDLLLNRAYDEEGYPCEDTDGYLTSQYKKRFNQLPQFDLFYYDGTHSKKTSAIFYYQEDPDYGVDAELLRRVKVTVNADYVFGTSIKDDDGRMLFFKKDEELKTIWSPGVAAPEISTIQFIGNKVDKGNLIVSEINQIADNQEWTITALSPTKFKILGSRSGYLGDITVPSSKTLTDEFTLSITAGAVNFAEGDTFKFVMRNKAFPRYAKKDENGNTVNVQGGVLSDVKKEGTWMTPRRVFENVERRFDTEIAYGDLIEHCRSIIKAQNGFSGSSFGLNNYRTLTPNYGFGGNIREYSENFPLLISLLLQQGISPLSVIDFAEQHYVMGLASIDQFLLDELATYISSTNIPVTPLIDAAHLDIQGLLRNFEQQRSLNETLKMTFADSTAGMTNWPLTLPMMGLVKAVVPHIDFDLQLGLDVIVHHDGHISPVIHQNVDFDKSLCSTLIVRSDGSKTPGTISTTIPVKPYARQLWFNPASSQLFAFSVIDDSANPPVGAPGDFWYNRVNDELYEWDTLSGRWNLSSESITSRWIPLRTDNIRNSLILAVENKLYDSVHPMMVQKAQLDSFYTDSLSQIELASFAAKYKYDSTAPIFDASDAFTWNYKSALGHARWFDVYASYFSQSGMSPTCRPNLEPWCLIGYPSKTLASANLGFDWDEAYADTTNTRLWTTQMWLDIIAIRPGIKPCVDIKTDALLPPYVSAQLPESEFALLTVTPAGITNGFMFGDDGPVENVWRKSLEFKYGMARVLFKRDPLSFLTKLWGETFISSTSDGIKLERNLMQPLAPSKFQLHGERLHIVQQRNAADHLIGTYSTTATVKFEVAHVEDNETYFNVYVNGVLKGTVKEKVAFTLVESNVNFTSVIIDDLGIPFCLGDTFTITSNSKSFTPSNTKKLIGMGQLFTNLLKFSYVDTAMSRAANAYRGWTVNLIYRLGGLIRGNSLQINSALGILPETAFKLLVKKAEQLNGRWISALRIQLVEAGKRISNDSGDYVPFEDAADWKFRVETYNAQHPYLEYYVADVTGDYETFNALSKQSTANEWKRFVNYTTAAVATTPVVIEGLQNLINFIFGYVDYLTDAGFTVNATSSPTTDEETGRNLDWQLEIEKFINQVYTSMGPGDGYILNPFMSQLHVSTPKGLMSKFTDSNFIDVSTAQAVFDVTGAAIPVKQLAVIRNDDYAVTYSDVPIFSAHMFTDEFEHVVIFNDRLSDEIGSSTIFDSFLGMQIDSAYMSYVRQAKMNRKPVFDGFVLNGDDVQRNIASSTTAINSYYDASKTFGEDLTSRHAMSLLGFNSKSYFSDMGISDATQFNFWRGLVQAKGTNMSIDAFVNYKKFTDALVDEYWAYKVAEYGDARPRTQPEIKIEQADCQQSFTQLQFYNQTDVQYTPLNLFTQIEASDDARWFSLDDLGNGLKFDAQPLSITVNAINPGYYKLNDIFHNGDQGNPSVRKNGVVTTGAQIISANLLKVTTPGNYVINGYTWANPTTQSPAKLFDYQENTLDAKIALWHPAIGIHSTEPLEIVNTISSSDPALYNYSTQISDNANLTTFKPWGKKEIGRVWWDTNNLGYVPYYDATIFPNRNERTARWGSLAEWSTIDLYQWVESTVHPSEYDALAISQEGQSDIPIEQRASGKAAKKTFYSRDRSITMRPIAWSEAGVGDAAAHPSFGPAVAVKVLAAGGALFTDALRCEAVNLTEGRHFSAWSTKPVGEVVITNQVVYDIGSAVSLSNPSVTNITIDSIENGRLGQRIGKINLSLRNETGGATYLRMSDDFNFYQEVEVPVWLGSTTDVRDFKFTDFGLTVSAKGSLTATAFAASIVAGWTDVYIREGVRYDEIIPLPVSKFINDETDPDYSTVEYGWKVWSVPTQAQLDADLVYPRNTWQPYLGDEVEVGATSALVAEMKTEALVMKNGVAINRYKSIWTDWVPLTTKMLEVISTGATSVSFNLESILNGEEVDLNRLSVYANGIQMNPQSYDISGVIGKEVVKIVNILPEGTTLKLIYRLQQPTLQQLEFDPEIKDDPELQRQFKADYQFTKVDVRNEAGVISSAKYYFWVTDNTIVQSGKSMSLAQAKSVLANGPSQFMIFSQFNTRVNAYDSCAIAGLNMLVTNNNTYKLRFSHNLTLLDDPEQLNLKNVHTEWSLIRRSQTSKIPKSLWTFLTDAVAGMDAAGNALPSQARIDYDIRNSTNTRFGFKNGQIFAATELVKESIINTILNTSLTIKLGSTSIPDYITALNMDESDKWFVDPFTARKTMDLIWTTSRPRQINEIFFEALEDALANNYEFSDIFKTSLISVFSTTKIEEQAEGEITDGEF